MTPAEIETLVEQVGDEILGRLGLPRSALQPAGDAPQAPATAWPWPEGGYASSFELVCASPDATAADVRAACHRAREAGFPLVWTPVSLIASAVSALTGSPSLPGALIDFPSGCGSTPARLSDVETALRLGAQIVNLVLGAGRARADVDTVQTEVRAAAALCADAGVPLAVTLEAPLLTEADLARAAAAAMAGGADALVSSSGAHAHDFASERDIALLRKISGSGAAVVACGRIAGFGHAAALIAAGADRLAANDPWTILDAAPAQ